MVGGGGGIKIGIPLLRGMAVSRSLSCTDGRVPRFWKQWCSIVLQGKRPQGCADPCQRGSAALLPTRRGSLRSRALAATPHFSTSGATGSQGLLYTLAHGHMGTWFGSFPAKAGMAGQHAQAPPPLQVRAMTYSGSQRKGPAIPRSGRRKTWASRRWPRWSNHPALGTGHWGGGRVTPEQGPRAPAPTSSSAQVASEGASAGSS